MRVEDRAKRAVVAGGQRAAKRLAFAEFLPDAFVNQHVGVHRHADGQHHAGDARQRERGAHRAQDTHRDNDVGDQRDIRHQPGKHVVNEHEG